MVYVKGYNANGQTVSLSFQSAANAIAAAKAINAKGGRVSYTRNR